jgi:hypothetical protein
VPTLAPVKGGVLAALGAAIVIGAIAPGAAQAASPSCATRGHTVAANDTARVYSYGRKHRRYVYVCQYARGTGRLIVHEQPIATLRLAAAVLNGRLLTAATFSCNIKCRWRTVTIDTNNGRVLVRAIATDVLQLVVAPNGTFVQRTYSGVGGASLDLYGPEGVRNLDSGFADIANVALSRNGILYWTHDGESRVAEIF